MYEKYEKVCIYTEKKTIEIFNACILNFYKI